jgi:RNA polymerase sigma-70 factor (ECF subfamily)
MFRAIDATDVEAFPQAYRRLQMAREDGFHELMGRLRSGDGDAAAIVFSRFSRRLIALASGQFDTWIRHRVDLEGVVQSVYLSFFVRYNRGQFGLDDWENLWGLLIVITLRKCGHRREYLRAACRDVARDTHYEMPGAESVHWWQTLDREPTPLEAATLAESVEGLLAALEPPEREIAEMSLLGHSTAEIADRVGRSLRTVRRVREYMRDWLTGREPD